MTSALAQKPVSSTTTLAGLMAKWNHSGDETLRQAARELWAICQPLDERLIRGLRRAFEHEQRARVFGCAVRTEAHLRKAVRDELENQWGW